LVGIILIVGILKADSKDIPLMLETLVGSRIWATAGWIAAVVILVASIVVNRAMRQVHDQEIDRLARERDRLQDILIKREK
jgi:hypothetical protein